MTSDSKRVHSVVPVIFEINVRIKDIVRSIVIFANKNHVTIDISGFEYEFQIIITFFQLFMA